MEKYFETNPVIQQQHIDHINSRWGQLYHLEKEWAERAVRYLLLTNSGGAIATLSFLGAYDAALSLSAVKVALFLFVTGIILVGISTAKAFHDVSGLFKTYQNEVNEYFSDKKSWKDVSNDDDKRSDDDKWDYIFPYASFACFVIGCMSGAFALFYGT